MQLYDLMNYSTDLFEIDTFRKIVIRHWWKSSLFLLIPSQKKIVLKSQGLALIIRSVASSGGQGKQTYFMCMLYRPLEAELSISSFSFPIYTSYEDFGFFLFKSYLRFVDLRKKLPGRNFRRVRKTEKSDINFIMSVCQSVWNNSV